uniref:Uncharacterized protein n=1 Tax=Alexandrium catenella TaxID=2925 RepID=A0A7S1WDQ8_ALECA
MPLSRRCTLALLLGGALLSQPAAAERVQKDPAAPGAAPAPSPQAAASLKDDPEEAPEAIEGSASEQAAVDAKDASTAAASAEAAAHVAKEVAAHSIRMTRHAKAALKKAQEAVHTARVDTTGLSTNQTKALKAAEDHLAKASKTVHFGNASSSDTHLKERLARLKEKLDDRSKSQQSELGEMREELHALREHLKGTSQEEQIEAIERMLKDLESRSSAATLSHDELKAELERLREAVRRIEEMQARLDAEKAEEHRRAHESKHMPAEAVRSTPEEEAPEEAGNEGEGKEARADIVDGDWDKLARWGKRHHPHPGKKATDDSEAAKLEEEEEEEREEEERPAEEEDEGRRHRRPRGRKDKGGKEHGPHRIPQDSDKDESGAEITASGAAEAAEEDGTVAPPAAGASPIDIDTDMPYGDLEPFGREDTAQELTEASIRESNAMVDQLERAEVAEEKRAVFRALTRLRGAAITSFDGVARSQTSNIDTFNQAHQWREQHPLRHLANEESDISKWAFPDANF